MAKPSREAATDRSPLAIAISARLARQRFAMVRLVHWYLVQIRASIGKEEQLRLLRQANAAVRLSFAREQRYLLAMQRPEAERTIRNHDHVLGNLEKVLHATFASDAERRAQMLHALDEVLILQLMEDRRPGHRTSEAQAEVVDAFVFSETEG